jgi:dihydroorotate dehydrogenase (fumarate)
MNLSTHYLGLRLRNPFVVGASPFCDDVYVARKLQDAGAAAVIMRSLFEEQLEMPLRHVSLPAVEGSEAGDEFPEFADYQLAPAHYLRQVEHLKKTLTIPVIASLNGRQTGAWLEFAKNLESAGADAIELNFYHVVTDPAIAADQVETEMIQTVRAIAGMVRIPIAVKLSPYHASVAQLAVALELAGASGITVFNRFYQPDVNIEEIRVQAQLRLSESDELLLRLRWLAILSPMLRASLAATGGVHTSADAIKTLLTGAHAVQLVSVLLKHGPQVLHTLRHGLETWMRQHNFNEIEQFRGMLNLERSRDAAAFERANYIRVLQSWKV